MVNIKASNVLGLVSLISIGISFLILGYAAIRLNKERTLSPHLKIGKNIAELLCATAIIVVAIGLICVPVKNESYENENLNPYSQLDGCFNYKQPGVCRYGYHRPYLNLKTACIPNVEVQHLNNML